MRFDTKIAIAVRDDLATWQRLNVYTEAMFTTGNDDDDNRAVVRAVPAEALNLVGLGVYGPRGDVDRVTKGMRLHP